MGLIVEEQKDKIWNKLLNENLQEKILEYLYIQTII